MNRLVPAFFLASLFSLLGAAPSLYPADAGAGLEYGPYPVGFELVEAVDQSRSFPSADGSGFGGRPIRTYIWYPAQEKGPRPMTIGDFVQIAADDFRLSRETAPSSRARDRLPVPLAKGLDEIEIRALLDRPLKSSRGVEAARGAFPLLVLGQGLYYESPLSHVILCEYLASRGYVVASCPLLGSQYRLVNINVEDLETQIRDMEFVIAKARSRTNVHPRSLGIIGYDLGGMAGLILAMRNPGVEAFLSLDCAIIYFHFSGLPGTHPQYREDRFAAPWMHITQGRFVEAARQGKNPILLNRKAAADSWIVSVPTDCHGQFTSYATFGISREVRGYWNSMAEDAKALHDGICRLAGDFFDGALRKDVAAAEKLRTAGAGGGPFKIDRLPGVVLPPSSRALMHEIIEKGLTEVRPIINRIRAGDPEVRILDEKELNWLAYHFLLWWGREDEALEVFHLNADLNPGSADACAELGSAFLILDRKDEAIAAFRRALEIKPDMPSVKAALESLTEKK